MSDRSKKSCCPDKERRIPHAATRTKRQANTQERITSIRLLLDRIEIVFERLAKLSGQAAANSTRLAHFPGIRRFAARVASLRNGWLIGCAASHTATGRFAHAHAD